MERLANFMDFFKLMKAEEENNAKANAERESVSESTVIDDEDPLIDSDGSSVGELKAKCDDQAIGNASFLHSSSVASASTVEGTSKCSYCSKKKDDLKKCRDCLAVSYCDRQCQKAHWQQHKLVCQGRSGKENEKECPKEKATASDGSKSDVKNSKLSKKMIDSKIDDDKLIQFDCQNDRPEHEYVPCFYCNTPRKELQKCAKCRIAKYCNKMCQKAHWSKHKPICNMVHQEVYLSKESSSLKKNNEVVLRGNQNNPHPVFEKHALCVYCKKSSRNLVRCSKCGCVDYCDLRCEANHQMEHKSACKKYPGFMNAYQNSSPLLQLAHGLVGTQFVLPPLPNMLEFLIGLERKEKRGLLLLIVSKYYHPHRYGVFVQDVNGEMTHILFYHKKEEEATLLPTKMSQVLQPGNYIHWFYPRWRFFIDQTVGFRIDSLDEVEFLQKQKAFDILDPYSLMGL